MTKKHTEIKTQRMSDMPEPVGSPAVIEYLW